MTGGLLSHLAFIYFIHTRSVMRNKTKDLFFEVYLKKRSGKGLKKIGIKNEYLSISETSIIGYSEVF